MGQTTRTSPFSFRLSSCLSESNLLRMVGSKFARARGVGEQLYKSLPKLRRCGSS